MQIIAGLPKFSYRLRPGRHIWSSGVLQAPEEGSFKSADSAVQARLSKPVGTFANGRRIACPQPMARWNYLNQRFVRQFRSSRRTEIEERGVGELH